MTSIYEIDTDQYEVAYSSSIAKRVSSIAFSIIIFDKNELANENYMMEYGDIQDADGNFLISTTEPIYGSNFILGINSFNSSLLNNFNFDSDMNSTIYDS